MADEEKKSGPDGRNDYDAYKERQRQIASDRSAAGRDIGEIPPVESPEKKTKCREDFRAFCESYFPEVFTMGWSPDHLTVMQRIETAVLRGGLFAMAMPRGSGKTSLCESACLWSILYGHRRFVVLIGSDEGSSKEMLESVRGELENNELLYADFPEACYPIAALEGIANRCKGQTCGGERTQIRWTGDTIVLPTIDGSASSGAIVRVRGITGRVRGMKFKRPDGTPVRPDLVIPDDPQTDESARSATQCATRESILAGAILGLSGPGKKISGVMPCTIIRPGDMAHRILDREKHPDWHGMVTKLVYEWPANEGLWREYSEVRAREMQDNGDGSKATDFYRRHRKEMDRGARVAWEERHNPDELSAIQHAWNLRLLDEAAFFAEYQNDPIEQSLGDQDDLTADQIASKLNSHARGHVPAGTNIITAFIDVQKNLNYWIVCAWESDFTGAVLDYGTFPDQRLAYFTAADARRTLAVEFPAATHLEGRLYMGLERTCDLLLERSWQRDDGAELRIDRLLIDANWGQSTNTVYRYCRQSRHPQITPSHGMYVGASSTPMNELKKKKGERVGDNWRVPAVAGKRVIRHCNYDTNHWKSFLHARLAASLGSPGSLSLFGGDPKIHRLISDHLTSEYRIRTQGRGREVDEWKLRPDRTENHWLDGAVGSCVAASMQGVALPESQASSRSFGRNQRKSRFKDLAAKKSSDRRGG